MLTEQNQVPEAGAQVAEAKRAAETSAIVLFELAQRTPAQHIQQQAKRTQPVRPSDDEVVPTSFLSWPNRAKPERDIGSKRSCQARPAECGSKIKFN